MLKRLMRKRPESLLTYGLVCLFGIGSWIAINGIWAEISILVNCSPEGYKLPAVLVVMIQIANVGPLSYTIVKYLFYRCKLQTYQIHLEIGTIFILIVIGISACVLLSFFWNWTYFHGLPLFTIVFFLALVDCTSSVVFIPFMKHFPPVYLSALYIGEGFSGLLPSLFALVQGSIRDNVTCTGNVSLHESLGIRFGPNIFFLFLGGMMLLCGLSFVGIITIPAVRKYMVKYPHIPNQHSQVGIRGKEDGDQGGINNKEGAQDRLLVSKIAHFSVMNICRLIWSNADLYICLSVLSFLNNGALSAVSSFTFLPYGNNVYHITINLALLANPLMSLVFILLPSKSRVVTVVTTVITCVLGIYILVMTQHPVPSFQAHTFEEILIVSCCDPPIVLLINGVFL